MSRPQKQRKRRWRRHEFTGLNHQYGLCVHVDTCGNPHYLCFPGRCDLYKSRGGESGAGRNHAHISPGRRPWQRLWREPCLGRAGRPAGSGCGKRGVCIFPSCPEGQQRTLRHGCKHHGYRSYGIRASAGHRGKGQLLFLKKLCIPQHGHSCHQGYPCYRDNPVRT